MSSERTPLLVPPPTTVDASPEARLETHQSSDDFPESLQGKPDDAQPPHTLSIYRIGIATLALALLIFLQATNISLLSTTQSDIAEELEASDLTSWFTSTYLIAMSSLGPLNGKLAAVFSPRSCISVASIIFAIGTLVSGLAADFSIFILGRVLTGIGASGVFTVSIIVVLELASAERRGLAIGLLNTGFTIGVAVGATAAGALLPHVGWRWLFLAQTPIAVLGGASLFTCIPRSFTMGKQSSKSISWQLARLDYLGAISLTTTIVLVLYALSSPKQIPKIPLILSPFTLALFLIIELYVATEPIIPISLLKSRGLLLSCLGTVGYMMARWTVLFYTPTYAIAVRGWSPASAGSILVPTNAGFALGGLLVGWVHIRRHGSFYLPTLLTYIIFPITLAWLSALVMHDSNVTVFILDVFLCGFVTGAAVNYSLAHVLHLTPKSTHYIATSLLATFRGFSGSFGSAIGGGLFTRTLSTSLISRFSAEDLSRDELVHRLLGSPALVQKLEGIERDVAIAGYEDALRVLFQAGAVLAAVTVLVQAGTGWRAASKEDVDDEDDTPP